MADGDQSQHLHPEVCKDSRKASLERLHQNDLGSVVGTWEVL